MRNKSLLKRQKGVGLIEVLVSMVVLSLCMLGMAALQTVSLRNNQSAQSRSMATIMSASITESMRANVIAAKGGEYNVDTCSSASGTSLASTDVASWLNALKGAIGRTACGGIVCRNATCDITVQWDDSRATSGKSAFSVTTRVIL
ncbi:type IV pilus modification protein PilV [Zoogloea oryzae]|uniref:Type IV pilus modification protein PilV n=1 Tax=Zoogloea oryzae TaxID=310767 RepID=A0ABQ6FF13_9RHOO|nr:type IV pilus modification protein PilV [Zoogloea oryzae]GLT23075.1 type IV pilus modification protein PilV [Zoogloea oryzae]